MLAPLAAQGGTVAVSRAELDSAYSIVRTRSVHRGEVEWRRIDSIFHAGVRDASTDRQKVDVFRSVFAALGDVHSSIVFDGQHISHYRGVTPAEAAIIGPLITKSNEATGRVIAGVLPGGVGYVLVPGYNLMGLESVNRASADLRRAVCARADRAPNGWIIDLRLNGGGNIYPMLSGLGDLLGDGVVLHGVSAEARVISTWAIQSGVLTIDGSTMAAVSERCQAAARVPRIAVLIGAVTRSSGQITAIAFAGRPGVQLFGGTTATGYATSNNYYRLSPWLALNLSEHYFTDRTGKLYRGIVHPDREIRDLALPAGNPTDATVAAALTWIAKGGLSRPRGAPRPPAPSNR